MRKYLAIHLLLAGTACLAQVFQGELRLLVVDASGSPVEATVELSSRSSQTLQTLNTDLSGRQMFKGLPFGRYRVQVQRSGFAPASRLVTIESQFPREEKFTLSLAAMSSSVDVSATLTDPREPGSRNYIGADELQKRPISFPGRTVLDLVLQQPGWVQEGSGVVHPRGVDGGTQYLIDGFPITDVRSPAFAPELNVENFASMNILTSGFPAEYGRRLGGIVEVDTKRDFAAGWHGEGAAEGGSFDTGGGYLATNYARGATSFGLSGRYSATDRYLDPPVEENYTNHGAETGETVQLEHDFTERDRLRVGFSRSRTQFLAPNELVQQEAGQRQDRGAQETMGQISYQRIISPSLLADIRAMVRDLSAGLQSNPLSTPVTANQDRGFRETYLKGAVTAHHGRHEFKTGAEAVFTVVREQFGYAIMDPGYFDPSVPRAFLFSDRRQSREQSFFVQDLYRLKNLTVSLGMRYDHYRLLVDEQAWSPRAGLSFYWPFAKLMLRGSYDRVFQPPPIQNLLVSSSAAALGLTRGTTGLPVPAARGNFWEGGFSRTLASRMRIDAAYFRRDLRNWPDDSFLLNTGISFPTSNYSAEIKGFETKIEVPGWGPISGFASYTNQVGTGLFPITGGLILENAALALTSRERFDLSTVQRNTISAALRSKVAKRYWIGLRSWYGSGLPVDLGGDAPADLITQYGERVVSRINFDRSRLRPSYSVDLSGGGIFRTGESSSIRVQGEILNLTDRLNVLNFAGLFSGSAIAAPRSYHIRLGFSF